MNTPFRPYRLVARGAAGLACDESGLALGGLDLARVDRSPGGAGRCVVRPLADFGRIIRAAYGPQTDAEIRRLHRGLGRAAAWIEAGDLGHAGVEAVMLRLPELTAGAMAKLAQMSDLEKGASPAWESEPRIPAGQTGGGQWTTGGASSAAAPAARPPARNGAPARSVRKPASGRAGGTDAKAPASRKPALPGPADPNPTGPEPAPIDAGDRGLLVPVNTATTLVGPSGVGVDLFALPQGAARLGRAGLLTLGAELLNQWDDAVARRQITDAITRFELDDSRPADVIAASAYVWSRYALPLLTEAPFSGPKLDAASEAVMRAAMVFPGAFTAMFQGPPARSEIASEVILTAALGGMINYEVAIRARPPGVAPELQTTSSRARAAIASQLKNGRMQAHHLVPAAIWKQYIDVAKVALKAGWRPDDPDNLIGLPADQATWQLWGGSLPMHNIYHRQYNAEVGALIAGELQSVSGRLSPYRARSILDGAALYSRLRIRFGAYNPLMRVSA